MTTPPHPLSVDDERTAPTATSIPARLPPIPVPPAQPERLARGSTPPPLPEPAALIPRVPRIEVVGRARTYGFVLDEHGQPIEIGSGRFAKAYVGIERWIESKTEYERRVAIKVLQKGVSIDSQLRFQLEKAILERVQGHPNIVELLASGEGEAAGFIPPQLQGRIENDFMVLELLDMSLEERLKGSRLRGMRDDLLAVPMRERIFRVLDYLVPVATALEFAHIERDTCHRDVKPANVLLRLPNPRLRGSQLAVKLADFNVGKAATDDDDTLTMTRLQTVPGTIYFQSPEQECNVLEVLVNVERGSAEVEYFEDFYTDIDRNDAFALFNRDERYGILGADRARKRILLDRPYAEPSEANVRARVVKAVGRPADIYSLGALFYYLISGAYANPKALYDAFRKFIEYDGRDETNTIDAYLDYEYGMIRNLRAPRTEPEDGTLALAPGDRFFSYKHYLDGNGELIDPLVMHIIARAMIRTKADSYCRAWDLQTEGISAMVVDLIDLYLHYGVDPRARLAYQAGRHGERKPGAIRRLFGAFGRKR
jgi:serine/threonine protein kinase